MFGASRKKNRAMKTPATPEELLLEAQSAFAEGNYARVRERALPLASSDDASTRESAQKLLSQIAPAPVGKYLFLLTGLLLLFVTYFAYSK